MPNKKMVVAVGAMMMAVASSHKSSSEGGGKSSSKGKGKSSSKGKGKSSSSEPPHTKVNLEALGCTDAEFTITDYGDHTDPLADFLIEAVLELDEDECQQDEVWCQNVVTDLGNNRIVCLGPTDESDGNKIVWSNVNWKMVAFLEGEEEDEADASNSPTEAEVIIRGPSGSY